MVIKHLLVGYGKWGTKVERELQYQKKFKINLILTKHKKSNLKNNKIINKKIKLKNYEDKFDSAHICSNLNSHYFFAKDLIQLDKNVIIEKPPVQNLKQINKLINLSKNKKKTILVNYIDNFNEGINYIKKNYISNQRITKAEMIYSKYTNHYKKNFECINDWLDHPISLAHHLFGLPKKYYITNFKRKKIKNYIQEDLDFNFIYKKFIFSIKIKNSKKTKIKRNFFIETSNSLINYNDNKKKIIIRNKNSNKSIFLKIKSSPIENLYNNFYKFIKSNKKNNNLNLAKIVLKNKLKILKKLKNKKTFSFNALL